MQDDLRAELIKQFPSEVIETKDMTGKEYYACPTEILLRIPHFGTLPAPERQPLPTLLPSAVFSWLHILLLITAVVEFFLPLPHQGSCSLNP